MLSHSERSTFMPILRSFHVQKMKSDASFSFLYLREIEQGNPAVVLSMENIHACITDLVISSCKVLAMT